MNVNDVVISKNNNGNRIDKFLKKEIFLNDEKITRGEVIRHIKNGKILVNDKKIKPSYILKENDKITLNFKSQILKLIPNDKIKVEIIYKDENIIAVNKPVGISVHPARLGKNNTLVNWLIIKFPEIQEIGEDPMRPGIVHRLDKDTSGVMIAARNQKAFEELKNLFKNRKIEKKYLALVYGKLKNKQGVINKPIARSSNYKKQVIVGRKTKTKIRPAITEYKVIEEFSEYSLLEIKPRTGRMHQIRVHMASIGCPIVGDKVYKLKNIKIESLIKKPACDAMRSIMGRQLLHAKSLKFKLFGKNYSFETKLPDDFKAFLNRVDERKIKS